MTEQTPFNDLVSKDDIILNVAEKGIRPIFETKIPSCYQKLIEDCWEDDPKRRPTFDQIVEILRNDDFALNEYSMNTNIDELHEYQNRIDSD